MSAHHKIWITILIEKMGRKNYRKTAYHRFLQYVSEHSSHICYSIKVFNSSTTTMLLTSVVHVLTIKNTIAHYIFYERVILLLFHHRGCFKSKPRFAKY